MRITQEADYALRICAMLAGLVHSSRGINGGFTLEKEPKDISLRMVIEAIDGPVAIRHCLIDEHSCNYQQDKSKCRFHVVFQELNSIIISRLDMLTLADIVDTGISVEGLIEGLHKF